MGFQWIHCESNIEWNRWSASKTELLAGERKVKKNELSYSFWNITQAQKWNKCASNKSIEKSYKRTVFNLIGFWDLTVFIKLSGLQVWTDTIYYGYSGRMSLLSNLSVYVCKGALRLDSDFLQSFGQRKA